MRILAVETSCDETAIAMIEAEMIGAKTKFKILGNDLSSQIALHTQYGGVFPMMAKREHGKNIVSIFEKVLKEAKLKKLRIKKEELRIKDKEKILKILERENDLGKDFFEFVTKIEKPKIDAIAVTTGPGLEPALWVGISFAKALSYYWNIPIVPVNHMEGHIFSIFPKKGKTFTVENKKGLFPMLTLLVSGGHTELILIKDWQKYKKIGQTRDDAAGEAFDKVARMLGLPYPGGPEISRLANEKRTDLIPLLLTKEKDGKRFHDLNNPSSILPLVRRGETQIQLPRPMIYSKDYDFSFSGIKTAVLYLIRDLKEKNPNILDDIKVKQQIACEFENAVVETLVHKTIKAIRQHKIKTLIVGGGVSANKYLQEQMENAIKVLPKQGFGKIKVYFPSKNLTGDNALMIAIAGYFQYKKKKYTKNFNLIKAKGNLSL